MVSGPSAVGSTPTINFRPDPGEPAVRLSAREPQTATLVAGQELRNETRLRQRALVRGDDVLFTNRTFTLSVGQTSPVFQAGLTSVVTRTDPNEFVPNQQPSPADTNPSFESPSTTQEKQTKQSNNSEEQNSFKPQGLLDGEANEKTSEELEQEERELENEDTRLERNLTQARLQQEQALELGNFAQLQQAERKEQELKREQEELDEELQQVELERLENQLEDTLETANQAIEDTISAALAPLDVLFGLMSTLNDESNRETDFAPRNSATPQAFDHKFAFDNTFFARKQ